MVERYRPGNTRGAISAAFKPASRKGAGVGRASIKKSTIDKGAKEGKALRKSFSGKAADAFQNFGLAIGMGTNNALSQSQYGFYPIPRVRTMLDWSYCRFFL